MATKGPTDAQSLIGTLHSRGWTDSAIGAAMGRNSSLIHQGAVGKKPLNNALDSLREMVASGAAGPPSSKAARMMAPAAQPTPRTRASGQPARVREGREAQAERRAQQREEGAAKAARHIGRKEFAKARELPNGQKSITGTRVASARFAADVADGMSANARVKVVYKGADGKWHTIGAKGGFTPEKLKEYARGKRGSASMADVIEAMIDDFYEGGEEPAESGEVEFYVVQLGRA